MVQNFKHFIHTWLQSISVGWFLATRQIRRGSKWTTALIISIMVLTFLNLVVVSGLLIGLISGSYAEFREGYSGDVYVTPRPGREYIEQSQELIKFAEAHPAVLAVAPRYSKTATILGTLTDNPLPREKPNQAGVALMGVDPHKEEQVINFSQYVIDGDPLEPGDDNYILIGANLIKKYSSFADVDVPGLELLKDVEVGSKVRLTMNDGGESRTTEYIVKGILKTKIDQISARTFITDTSMRKLLSTNHWEVEELAITTKPGADKQVVADMRSFVESTNRPTRVQTSLEAIPTFLRDIETTMSILGNALSSFALVVALITVFIVIFINAVTRRKFIGIMKGIGIEPRVIQISYVFQALFYAAVGSGIGLALTFGFLRPYFAANPIDFPFSDGILVATLSGSMIRVGILLLVTLIAGFVPATLIVRKNTLDSILGR